MGLFINKKDAEITPESNSGTVNYPGLAEITAKPEEAKRGVGRPRGSGAGVGNTAISGKSQPDSSKVPDELYKGENWQEVASIPFAIRRIMTGSAVFELEKKQKEVLGVSLAALMKSFAISDPRYVAMTIFFANMGAIWAEKEVLYKIENPGKKEKTENA